MKFAFFGRPKREPVDARTRLLAVRDVTDQSVLAEMAQSDADPEIRRAAFQRLSDEKILVRFAQGNGEFNLAALQAVTDGHLITEVAQRAESPTVRAEAVRRVSDPLVLQRISAQDTDATVRRLAKMQLAGPGTLHHFLRVAMRELQIAERKAEEVADFCGGLDDVCGALVRDRSIHINGVVDAAAESLEPDAAGGTGSRVAGAPPEPAGCRLELLAERVSGVAPDSRVFITIRRVGEDAYHCKQAQWTISSGRSQVTGIPFTLTASAGLARAGTGT
jgi:hypothetical protein